VSVGEAFTTKGLKADQVNTKAEAWINAEMPTLEA
jgi:hypothetical protein